MRYFIGGVAVGAVLGALFSPKKGSEWREDLGEWSREKGEELASKLGGIVPFKVKAAAALGALKEGGAEALREGESKIRIHLDGGNR